MWARSLSRTFHHITSPPHSRKGPTPAMHGSLHMIVANESVRIRQADAAAARSRRRAFSRRPAGAIARLLANRASAQQGFPTRAAPGPEHRSRRGHTAAAPLRGR